MNAADVIVREHHEPLVRLDAAEFDLKPIARREATDEPIAWLRETLVKKLRTIRSQLPEGWAIRINSGWRSLADQRRLYDELVGVLRNEQPSLDEAALRERAAQFVAPLTANPPAPHTTGGAVDFTFVGADGHSVNFGTPIGQFSERAHPNYFDHHAPATKEDNEAKANRQLLTFLMESQEFVVHPYEWWHWEFGTPRWAAAKGIEVARYGPAKPDVTNSY